MGFRPAPPLLPDHLYGIRAPARQFHLYTFTRRTYFTVPRSTGDRARFGRETSRDNAPFPARNELLGVLATSNVKDTVKQTVREVCVNQFKDIETPDYKYNNFTSCFDMRSSYQPLNQLSYLCTIPEHTDGKRNKRACTLDGDSTKRRSGIFETRIIDYQLPGNYFKHMTFIVGLTAVCRATSAPTRKDFCGKSGSTDVIW
ncbi:hypothetical protein J6590_012995 [Homalodisca vitripennis]|nr:hypothetical protein J6590_012995 [Homalodisca vitripennis]